MKKQQIPSAQDDAHDPDKMLVIMRAKHAAELKKAVDAEDFEAAHALQEKFTEEEARLQTKIKTKTL